MAAVSPRASPFPKSPLLTDGGNSPYSVFVVVLLLLWSVLFIIIFIFFRFVLPQLPSCVKVAVWAV